MPVLVPETAVVGRILVAAELPMAVATALIVTPAQATSASSNMSAEHAMLPSPPVAGCRPAFVSPPQERRWQATSSSSSVAAAQAGVRAVSGCSRYCFFSGACSVRSSFASMVSDPIASAIIAKGCRFRRRPEQEGPPTHGTLTGASYRRRRLSMALAHGANHKKIACEINKFTICSQPCALESDPRNEPFMADQIVITEKTSQAKDIRAAVGSRYGDILPAEGHLFDLLEPEDVVPAWKHWSPILLRPIGNGRRVWCCSVDGAAGRRSELRRPGAPGPRCAGPQPRYRASPSRSAGAGQSGTVDRLAARGPNRVFSSLSMDRGYFGDHLHSLLRIEGDPIARRLTENDLFFAWLAALLAPAADSFFQKVDPGNVRPPGF
jgi:hypothetical protein